MNKAEALQIANLASDEARRAQMHLGRKRPRAYYVSHLIRDEEVWRAEARFGTVFTSRYAHARSCYTDVRVGSYRYDHVQDGGLGDNSKDDESYGHVDFPVGRQEDGIRHGLWKLTDARYREAVESFLKKRADELTYVNRNRGLPAFEKRPQVMDLSYRSLPAVDLSHWTDYVRRASTLHKRDPRIKAGSVLFEAAYVTRIFANSEGSLLVQRIPYWLVECYIWLLSKKGDAIPWTIQHYVTDCAELPSYEQFAREVTEKMRLLNTLAEAPTIRSFSGPALLHPRPAGLLVHEALGHRLEGNRLLAQGEGQTFRDSIGKQVLPEFLTLCDDASLKSFGGRSLVGHFQYDDEGVPAQSASLIDGGTLAGFLTSRAGIVRAHRSNGHARASRHERPISRMAVTIVKANPGLEEAELFERFLEEIKRQKVPYGIRIVHADGGETATEGYNFQAFLSEINLAARVFPDGREEWVRGVNFVGTPLNITRSIIAAGNQYEVDNAQCGAESGYVPVSTVSPALLVSRLELQSKSDALYREYTYPIPWADARQRGRGVPTAARAARRPSAPGRRAPRSKRSAS